MRKTAKLLHVFLLSALCITGAKSATNSKKTFLAPRPVGVNLAMELSTWHDQILNRDKNKFNSHIQATGFYQAAIKGADVGKYFGVGNGKNDFTVGTGASDIHNWDLVHNNAYVNHPTALAGTSVFNPKQEAYGLRLDFFQFMNHPFKNMFLKASVPFVCVENDMHFLVDSSVADASGNYVGDFFRGNAITQAAANKQDALTHAKVGERKTSTGIADIDLALGYRFVENENHHLYVAAAITIPTGKRPHGEYLFEPIYGNGKHFGLGLDVDASLKLWKRNRHTGKLIFAVNYRYLFEGTEKRTIPVADINNKFMHYYLAGKVGNAAGTNLFPAANVLTQNVSVRPGNQIDGLLALSFKSGRFLIDVGYNLFTRESESVTLRNWEDDTYGIANADLDVSTYTNNGNFTLADDSWKTLNLENLDVNGAATPSYLTNKAFGSIGYKLSVLNKYPTYLTFGASYEFASSNYELEGYAFWGKFAISF